MLLATKSIPAEIARSGNQIKPAFVPLLHPAHLVFRTSDSKLMARFRLQDRSQEEEKEAAVFPLSPVHRYPRDCLDERFCR